MMDIKTVILMFIFSLYADAGNWEWTREICDFQNTEFMKCRCRPHASGTTCSDTEPVEDPRCFVQVSSRGLDDPGCDGDHRDDCAILTVYQDSIGTVDEFRLIYPDPGSDVKRGIVLTTFDPDSCRVGETTLTFDTYNSYIRAYAFQENAERLPVGTVAIIMTADEYTQNLRVYEQVLWQMGSPATDHAHRSSLSIIAKRTNDGWCTVASDYKEAGHGPAVVRIGAQAMIEPQCIN